MHAGDAGTHVGHKNVCLGHREACWGCRDTSRGGGLQLGVQVRCPGGRTRQGVVMHEMGAVVVSRLRLCSPGAAPDTRWRGLYVGDALSMHLGVQDVTVHDGEDSEDGKGGGSGMEGGRLGS